VTECQRCSCKSQLFLCNDHISELREMFNDLPRLIHHLEEAATGQTKLGEQARRSRSDEAPMRVNFKASDLLKQANSMLVRRVRDICEGHSITYVAVQIYPLTETMPIYPGEVLSQYSGDAAKLSFWLAQHADSVAADSSAGDCFAEVHGVIGRILTAINRPIPPRFCGPCPSPHPEDDGRQCGLALMARRDADEVRCQQCGNAHNVEELLGRLLIEVDHWRFTAAEILIIMETLGDRVSKRTFQHWRKTNVVMPSGWRRSDGRVTLRQHDNGEGEPMYRLSDVRRAKTRTATKTGAQ